MTQLDQQGPSEPVSVPFTPRLRDNPEELAVIPDEIARAHELPSRRDDEVCSNRLFPTGTPSGS